MEISPNFTIGSTERAIMKGKESNSDLNMDDFLKIMAASLRMPAMSSGEGGGGDSSTDFMAQMMQFTTMEQMQGITQSLTTSMLMTQQQQALTMIGKEATVIQDGRMVSGIVEKAKFFNGYATLQINGEDFYMSNVQEVGLQKHAN